MRFLLDTHVLIWWDAGAGLDGAIVGAILDETLTLVSKNAAFPAYGVRLLDW